MRIITGVLMALAMVSSAVVSADEDHASIRKKIHALTKNHAERTLRRVPDLVAGEDYNAVRSRKLECRYSGVKKVSFEKLPGAYFKKSQVTDPSERWAYAGAYIARDFYGLYSIDSWSYLKYKDGRSFDIRYDYFPAYMRGDGEYPFTVDPRDETHFKQTAICKLSYSLAREYYSSREEPKSNKYVRTYFYNSKLELLGILE